RRLLIEDLADTAHLVVAQLAIRDELRQQQIRGTLEQLACQVPDRALARSLLANPWKVAMRPTIGLMANVFLGFEVAQDREHRGVCQRIAQLVLHLGYGGSALLPEHGHDFGFAIAERHAHGLPSSARRCAL